MGNAGFVKNVGKVSTYRLTQPEGNNRTIALLIDKIIDGSQNFSMGLCVIDPKSQVPYHAHETEDEAMYILRGKGIAKIEDVQYDLCKGSIMLAPRKIKHQIINPNNQKLWFIFVYGPAGPEESVRTRGTPTEPIKP